MKKLILFAALFVIVIASCTKMEDNYQEYLDRKQTYSPAVTNVTAVSPELGSLTLNWDLPTSERVKSVEIVRIISADEQDTTKLDLVTSYTYEGMEPQQYTFHLYTRDAFKNLSIPVIVSFLPIPGRE
ncbi:MAG: hypothetical protein IJ494_08255 [Bacteroides sp.]|nr:hypothetical protein [Bacteroides sp.]